MFCFYKGNLCVAQSTLDRVGMGQTPLHQGSPETQEHRHTSRYLLSPIRVSLTPLPLKIVIMREDREGSGNQKCLKVSEDLCKVVSPLSCT